MSDEPTIRAIAAELGLDDEVVSAAASVASPPSDPIAIILAPYRALAAAACAGGDHQGEWRVAQALLDRTDALPASVRAEVWLMAVGGAGHRETDPALRASRVRAVAADAAADVRQRASEEELGAGRIRTLIDPIAEIQLVTELAAGMEPTGVAADLARRRDDRNRRTPTGPSFAARHVDELVAVLARDGRTWLADRYRERHGSEPPEGWWVDDPESPMGGRIDPEYGTLFELEDRVDFFDEMEARYRNERGLPARGEGLVSQRSLAACVRDVLPDAEVVVEARLPWLGGQRFDVWVPSLQVAFEYQGEQHFFPLEHWGGEPGLADRQELDERKRDACARAGVRLIEWRYDEPISVEAVRRRLRPGLGEVDG